MSLNRFCKVHLKRKRKSPYQFYSDKRNKWAWILCLCVSLAFLLQNRNLSWNLMNGKNVAPTSSCASLSLAWTPAVLEWASESSCWTSANVAFNWVISTDPSLSRRAGVQEQRKEGSINQMENALNFFALLHPQIGFLIEVSCILEWTQVDIKLIVTLPSYSPSIFF